MSALASDGVAMLQPLFAATAQQQDDKPDPVRSALETLDVDALSPREALDTLYALKAQASETDT